MLDPATITQEAPPLPSITLRDYQETCVQRVLDAYQRQPHGGSALIVLATGGGKSLIFSEIARRLGLTTLIIAHREELLRQAADKFRMVDPTAIIGQVGAGRHEWGAPVTVASVQTISRPEHLKALQRFGYQLVIIDECFPAGTLIDGRPIEQIQIGDYVTAFDEHTHAFARKRVVRTFQRPVGSRLLKLTIGSTSVVCTPNHPFYTRFGWKPAGQLSLHDEVLYAGHDRSLLHLPEGISPGQEMAEGQPQSWQKPVLFGRLQEESGVEALVRNDGKDQQEVCFATDENQQSNAQRNRETQNASDAPGHGTCTQNTRRQRERANPAPEHACRSIGPGMAHGVRSPNPSAKNQPVACAHELQAGPCQSSAQTGDRDRWDVTCLAQSPEARSQKRAGALWARVDRLEIYESGRDGAFAALCPDGTVYNFEVEDYHTYLANGFVAHNCHHSMADGYLSVLKVLPDAFLVGVTATPDRLDRQDISSIFGEPVFSMGIIEMVEKGYLCDLRAIAVKTTASLDGLHTQAGDFKQDELEELVDTKERNERVVRAYLEHASGRQVICFAVTVAHAQHLAETFARFEVRAAMVCGETPPEERRRLLHDYERGALDVLCNVGIFTEGVDLPATSCIILARPTQSRALFSQCIGRGTRLAPGKRDCIILDITDNCLKHRLQPVTLSQALGKALHDQESVLEAKVREEEEREKGEFLGEREQQERRAKVTRRAQDLLINLLAPIDWKRRSNGAYYLEVGERKHRIALIPSEETEGSYTVKAALAPDYQWQTWLPHAPLEWAQQHAEIKAKLLQSAEKKRILVDSNAPWRMHPASIKQCSMLRKFGIEHKPDITAGEASDLIGKAIHERDRKKAEKKLAKLQQGEASTKRGRRASA